MKEFYMCRLPFATSLMLKFLTTPFYRSTCLLKRFRNTKVLMIGILDFGPRLRSLELFLSKYRFSLAFTLTVLLSQTPKKQFVVNWFFSTPYERTRLPTIHLSSCFCLVELTQANCSTQACSIKNTETYTKTLSRFSNLWRFQEPKIFYFQLTVYCI